MIRKRYLKATVAVLIAVLAGVVAVRTGLTARGAGASGVAAAAASLESLPASDVVVYVDTQRLLSSALPNFFAAQPAVVTHITSTLDRITSHTGVDPRGFDSISLGVRFVDSSKSVASKTVAIVRGRFDAASVIETGFARAKAECEVDREARQIAGHTVYVVKPPAGAGPRAGAHPVAIAVFDQGAIVAGDLESVEAALDSTAPRADADLIGRAAPTATSVVSYSGRIPATLPARINAEQVPGRIAPAARSFAAVREFYGSVNFDGTEVRSLATLRTENDDQAKEIASQIGGLKQLAGLALNSGAARGNAERRQSLTNLLNNLTVSNTQPREVQISIKATQSDLAPLVKFGAQRLSNGLP